MPSRPDFPPVSPKTDRRRAAFGQKHNQLGRVGRSWGQPGPAVRLRSPQAALLEVVDLAHNLAVLFLLTASCQHVDKAHK